MIVVIDYDMGNVGSVINMLKRIGVEAKLSQTPDDLLLASKLILPGVGAFDVAMDNLERLGYLAPLNYCVLEQKCPILGICLGMQLFTKGSEEGNRQGLNWLDAQTVRFHFKNYKMPLKVPHMGWNTIEPQQNSNFFLGHEEMRYYFVHSYHVVCNNPKNIIATTQYGYQFTSAVIENNIVGTQFHPEKSHRFGMTFLRQFAEWGE
jgi:glutamine amidotransferase